MNQFVVLGLGNPGDSFSHTRHNLGVDMIVRWVEYMRQKGATISAWKTHEKFHARQCEIILGEIEVSVLVPLVFMNESGKVLSSYLRYHEVDRKNILVIHDDLELSLGEVKFQAVGSAHGHNGMRSIHEYMGDTETPQLRIGIGRPSDATPIEKFVLSTFTPDEKRVLLEKEESIFEAITESAFPSTHMGERASVPTGTQG